MPARQLGPPVYISGMATNATLLAAVEAVIEKRLAGDAYTGYTEAGGTVRFQGTSLRELIDIRNELQAADASQFRLAEYQDQ